MPRVSKVLFHLLVVLVVLLAACQVETPAAAPEAQPEAAGFPIEFVSGSYELVGRNPDSDQGYTGTMVIGVTDSNSLSITRTVAGVAVTGTGEMTATGDGTRVLRIGFTTADGAFEATYLVESDLDNYARLTGYVYSKGSATTVPGIEAAFNDHFRAQ